ncbi:LysR substrate-binding domain-containing protein, partial [Burkholderia anthina]|uniref:LysR substrate-binding domain-containing protein n=1 Tax=Burkholderia anthina TaxID=179879 RepID=UPI001E416575
AAKRIRNSFKQRPDHQSEALFNSLLGQRLALEVEGPLILDNRNVIIEAALSGAGLAYVSEELAVPYLATGRLVALLPDWVPALAPLSFFYSGRRHLPAGLSAFIELVRALGNGSESDHCNAAALPTDERHGAITGADV